MISTSHEIITKKFDAFTDHLVKGLNDEESQVVLEALALKFVELVVSPPPTGTPIDTGRARAGWARAMEGLGGRFEPQGSDSKAISQGKRRGGLRRSVGRRKGHMGYVALTNNVEYLQYLEYGSSDQAPSGFIRKALESLRVDVRQEAKKDLLERLEEALAKANVAARAAGLKWKALS